MPIFKVEEDKGYYSRIETEEKELFSINSGLLCLENLCYVVSSTLLLLLRPRVSGAAGTEFRPSFIPVVDVTIDKSLSLPLRLVTYLDYIL